MIVFRVREDTVYVDSIQEAMKLVRGSGFSLWMKGESTKQRNLISPDKIELAGE